MGDVLSFGKNALSRYILTKRKVRSAKEDEPVASRRMEGGHCDPAWCPIEVSIEVIGGTWKVIIVRELGVTLLRFWVIRHGVIAASHGGKIKTLLQAIAIGLYLLPLGTWLDVPRWIVLGAALIATVVTGLDYVIRALRLRAAGGSKAGA